MNRQERFSLRKYKFGVASVLLGAVLVFGSAQASAEEQAASQTSAGTQLVATTQQAPAEEEQIVLCVFSTLCNPVFCILPFAGMLFHIF